MKLSELEKELEKSKKIKVFTHKMSKLEQMVAKGQEWQQQAKAVLTTEVQMTELTHLLSEARKIHIELDLFEDIKKRHTEAFNLISMSESTSSINASRKTRSKQKKNIKKKLTKEEAEVILQKLIDLKVNSPKIEALKEHLEIITKWEQESSKYCEEWENEGSSPNDQNLDQLKALISQSKTFRYKVKLVYKVQDKLDLLEWRDEAQEKLKELQSSK